MASQTQTYTPKQIEQIKTIVQKFDSDVDLDLNNFINCITIFDMLSESEIKFINNLKVPFFSNDAIKLEEDSLSPTSKNIIKIAIATNLTTNRLNKFSKNLVSYEMMSYEKDTSGWDIMSGVKNWFKFKQSVLDALPIDEKIPKFEMPDIGHSNKSDDTINLEQYKNFKKAIVTYLEQFQGSKALGEYQYANISDDIIYFTNPDYHNYHKFDIFPTYEFMQYKLPELESKKKSDSFHHFHLSGCGTYIYNETTNSFYISSDVKLHTDDFILKTFTNNVNSYFPQDRQYLSWKVTEPENGLTMFEFYKLIWLKSILSEKWNTNLPQTVATQKLAELLYLQAKDAIDKNENDSDNEPNVEIEVEISEAMRKFLRTFNPSLGGARYESIPTITYAEFYDFILAVRQQKKISSKIINWLSKSPKEQYSSSAEDEKENSDFIHSLIKDMNLAQSLTSVKDIKTIKEIKNLVSDDYTDFQIDDIYAINAPHKNDKFVSRFDLPIKHKTLVHGTTNSSILTILRDSLLTRAEIRQDAKVSLTGLGLGDGIYFAQPHQAGKSLGYVFSQNDYVYLFLADVAYSKINYVTKWGDSDINDGDLVYAKGIGANDRDEFVAKESSQVELKYLLAIHK